METQGTQKSQNSLEKGNQNWKTHTFMVNWFSIRVTRVPSIFNRERIVFSINHAGKTGYPHEMNENGPLPQTIYNN